MKGITIIHCMAFGFLLAACTSKEEKPSDGGQQPATPEVPQQPSDAEEPVSHRLCTKQPSAQAAKVYDYLWQEQGKHTLSGCMATVNWNTNEAEWVHRHAGKYPAVAGFDYIHLYASPASWIDYEDTRVVEDWWNANGLVTIGWHWNVPQSEDKAEYAFYTAGSGHEPSTDFDVEKAVQAGTAEYNRVQADLEKVAGCLAKLKEKGVPVLWRPLHEASGKWFWWGAKGAEPYKRLWKMMFDLFQRKGLDHLIWVWTSEVNDPDWYPGDNCVDIVGRDLYRQDDATKVADEYRQLQSAYPGKLVTLSECGSVATTQDQWRQGARWAWFMPWYDYDCTSDLSSERFGQTGHLYADVAWWSAALADEAVLTRDELPSLK